jgi:chaperonin GroES
MGKKTKDKKENRYAVQPLYDRVLLKRIEAAESARGGIIIPDTAREKPMEAEVVAAGSGKIGETGERIPLTVCIGDRVLVGKYAGTEVRIADEEFLVVREEEILATVIGK